MLAVCADSEMHIYIAKSQPATGWIDRCGDVEISGGFAPHDLIWCGCCGVKRAAKDCVVQCYYDGLSVWCAPEKGCKDPLVIAAKKAEEFHNRSEGQKKRFAKTNVRGF